MLAMYVSDEEYVAVIRERAAEVMRALAEAVGEDEEDEE